MRRVILLLTLVGTRVLACTVVVLAQSTTPSGAQQSSRGEAKIPPGQSKKVCPSATADTVRCHSQVRTDIGDGGTATDANGTAIGKGNNTTTPGQDSKSRETTGGADKTNADKTNAGTPNPSALATGSAGP